MEHQLRAVEHGVLEIIRKLDGVEVAGIGTELAEHAVAQVVRIIVEHLLFLTRFRILGHMAQNLDGSIGARLLTKRTSSALVVTILVALEYQAATMTLSHVECGLAVLRVLLCRLVGEEAYSIVNNWITDIQEFTDLNWNGVILDCDINIDYEGLEE